MKTFFFIVFLFVLISSANAQSRDITPLKFGIGATMGLPVGELGPWANFGFGLDLQGKYIVAPKIDLTLCAGYLNFLAKGGGNLEIGSIPILAGIQYFFSDKVYCSVQAGISFFTTTGSGSAFTFAPGVGIKLSKQFDVLVKYQSATSKENYFDVAFLGVRGGLSF